MRLSSGGSSRISKRFFPANALPAISIASPAIGIAAGCDPDGEARAVASFDPCSAEVMVGGWVPISIVTLGLAVPASPEPIVAVSTLDCPSAGTSTRPWAGDLSFSFATSCDLPLWGCAFLIAGCGSPTVSLEVCAVSTGCSASGWFAGLVCFPVAIFGGVGANALS
jgi:hypothetical protein